MAEQEITNADIGPVIGLHSGDKKHDKRMLASRRTRLYDAVNDEDGYPVITRGLDTLQRSGSECEYRKHYRLEDGPNGDRFLQEFDTIAVESVRDFGSQLTETKTCFPFLNPLAIREFCKNKQELFHLLPYDHPSSYFVDMSLPDARSLLGEAVNEI